MEQEDDEEDLWIVFVHASIDARGRKKQWEFYRTEDSNGDLDGSWGDFDDIINHEEKKGEKRRHESSFFDFRSFISKMQMG